MSEPFQWTPEQVGFYSGFGNFVMAISSLILTLITVWLMRSKPSPSDVRSSSIVQSLSGSNVALLDANDPPDPPAGRVETTSPYDLPSWLVLRSRRRMLIYTSCGLSLLTLSKLVMGSSFKLRPPWCHVAVLVALFISFARGAITSTLKSFLSSVHSPEGQGRLFSLVGVAEYCGMLVGLPGFAGLYGVTVSVCPGAVYFFSAGLILVTVALTL
ncbi:unnamed protein product [Dicrocoelium dendriticum]|nr:unnamed protein product [Dicrocoelium dendriticum]